MKVRDRVGERKGEREREREREEGGDRGQLCMWGLFSLLQLIQFIPAAGMSCVSLHTFLCYSTASPGR